MQVRRVAYGARKEGSVGDLPDVFRKLGLSSNENTWKSVPQLIELLSETVSKGGNLIMNVGPTARGEFDGT